MERAVKLGTPTPKVLYIGNYESVSYMIETCINGINGLDSAKPDEIWLRIGEYARKLHSLPISGFGIELKDEQSGVFADRYSQTLVGHIDCDISQLTTDNILFSSGVYDKKDLNDILRIFDYIKQRDYCVGFNHGDLSRKNTLVDEYGIVSLIDYGCAVAHAVPLFDFTYIFGETVKGREPSDSMIQSFIKGYGISSSILTDMKKDIFAVMLLSAFDKVNMAIEFNDPETQYYTAFAHKVLSHTLKYFN